MDLFFNELSLKNETGIHQDSINAMVMVYKELLKYHITTCRIAPKDNTKLFQMICALPDSVNVKNFYFSFFRSPYESETVEEKRMIITHTIGLAMARNVSELHWHFY